MLALTHDSSVHLQLQFAWSCGSSLNRLTRHDNQKNNRRIISTFIKTCKSFFVVDIAFRDCGSLAVLYVLFRLAVARGCRKRNMSKEYKGWQHPEMKLMDQWCTLRILNGVTGNIKHRKSSLSMTNLKPRRWVGCGQVVGKGQSPWEVGGKITATHYGESPGKHAGKGAHI